MDRPGSLHGWRRYMGFQRLIHAARYSGQRRVCSKTERNMASLEPDEQGFGLLETRRPYCKCYHSNSLLIGIVTQLRPVV